jgi:Fur family transcriptional regulator, ferric uptake regulator
MVDASPLLEALHAGGFRLTTPRRELAELIADRSGHFSAADLVADAREQHVAVGRATIFRTLDVLSAAGVVERIDLPSGEHAYLACRRRHHHHIVCSRCGRSSDIADAGIRAVVRDVAKRTGYRVDDHRLELFGLCPACQAAS